MTKLGGAPATTDGQKAARLYYGWIMLPLSMAALIASSPGQTFGALPIVYIGYLMDRHGLRRTMLGVVTFFAAACLVTSCAQSWLTLTFSFCLLRMLGPGALGFLSGNTLAYWFERRLGTVEGLRLIGMAVAMALIPALNLWLVKHWGWHGAYALLGVGLWLVLFPTFFLLFRNRPALRRPDEGLAGQLRCGAFFLRRGDASGGAAFAACHAAAAGNRARGGRERRRTRVGSL